MNRAEYLAERDSIVDAYIAGGDLRSYTRQIDALNRAADKAGLFADHAAEAIGVPNMVKA